MTGTPGPPSLRPWCTAQQTSGSAPGRNPNLVCLLLIPDVNVQLFITDFITQGAMEKIYFIIDFIAQGPTCIQYRKRVLMGVPSYQLTTNFSANCQLTTNFS